MKIINIKKILIFSIFSLLVNLKSELYFDFKFTNNENSEKKKYKKIQEETSNFLIKTENIISFANNIKSFTDFNKSKKKNNTKEYFYQEEKNNHENENSDINDEKIDNENKTLKKTKENINLFLTKNQKYLPLEFNFGLDEKQPYFNINLFNFLNKKRDFELNINSSSKQIISFYIKQNINKNLYIIEDFGNMSLGWGYNKKFKKIKNLENFLNFKQLFIFNNKVIINKINLKTSCKKNENIFNNNFNLLLFNNNKKIIKNNLNVIFFNLKKEYNPTKDIKINLFSRLNLNTNYFINEKKFDNQLSLIFITIDSNKLKTSFTPNFTINKTILNGSFISTIQSNTKLPFDINLNTNFSLINYKNYSINSDISLEKTLKIGDDFEFDLSIGFKK